MPSLSLHTILIIATIIKVKEHRGLESISIPIYSSLPSRWRRGVVSSLLTIMFSQRSRSIQHGRWMMMMMIMLLMLDHIRKVITLQLRGNAADPSKPLEKKDTIDFIFFDPKTLRSEAVLNLPSAKDLGEGLLPNMIFPSDHMSVVAKLSMWSM